MGDRAAQGGGRVTPRLVIDNPTPGYYWRRYVRNGPKVPVIIALMAAVDPETGEALDRSPSLVCLVGGEHADPYDTWTNCAGNPISAEDYVLMLAQFTWDANYAPGSPGANPRQPVDVRKLPPAF